MYNNRKERMLLLYITTKTTRIMESREERIRVSKELVKHRDWIRGVLNWKTYKLSPSEMESVEEKVSDDW